MASLTQRKTVSTADQSSNQSTQHSNGISRNADKHNNKSQSSSTQSRTLLQTTLELLLCTASIYACFLGYALLQERIYSRRYGVNQEKFTHSLLLVWVQCCGNAIFALFIMCATAIYKMLNRSSSSNNNQSLCQQSIKPVPIISFL
jgi:H+/gluconate symporter-like permease